MKKIISMLLVLSMMFAVLAACNNETPVENPDVPDNQEIQAGEVDDGMLHLVVDGASDYVIVRGESAYISEVTASTELQKYLKLLKLLKLSLMVIT